jgi:low affinity Fe/Cu permease
VTPDLATPGVLQLRLLEKRLGADIARMDARVDELLLSSKAPTDDEITEVDVLCASIAEIRELLEEARCEAARETLARRARRARPRRWV